MAVLSVVVPDDIMGELVRRYRTGRERAEAVRGFLAAGLRTPAPAVRPVGRPRREDPLVALVRVLRRRRPDGRVSHGELVSAVCSAFGVGPRGALGKVRTMGALGLVSGNADRGWTLSENFPASVRSLREEFAAELRGESPPPPSRGSR